ncbi:AMP-binding protein [Streptomyces hygroscopicus]|uniref:AMP-binding protein n=1 Tax=Streptomyces hygroscopicus TaxID=1912 RepID=UPI00363880B4
MSEVAFATSGSTGEPVEWLRTTDQLRDEAELVRATLLGRVDHVVSYAPTAHLYGWLYAEVLPELEGIPVTHAHTDPLAPLHLPDGARTLLVCLPSTWQLLARRTEELARHDDVIALHSTAPATPATHRVVQQLCGTGFEAHELLGSTETGAVAHRRISPEAESVVPWRLLPDVRRRGADGPGEQQLSVASPRLARRRGATSPPGAWQLPDLVTWSDARTFRHLGRASHLVKVNGRRCDLRRVEELARSCGQVLDAACVAVTDALRGEHYELYYATSDPQLDPATLRARLARLRAQLPAPRAVHKVPRIPRSSTGKVLTPRLTAGPHKAPRPALTTEEDPCA